MTRYSYHTGLASHQAAVDALDDAMAEGEVSQSENPQISTYHITTRDGQKVTRWQITLER